MSKFMKDQTKRTLPSIEEDEPVRLPSFDNTALLRRFRLTLVGRTFDAGGRSTEALLAFMPRRGIWDLEGRVHGTDLRLGRFYFDFETEEDLQNVLKKRQRRTCRAYTYAKSSV